MAKYQIDEEKRVVRAKTPADAIGTLPEIDDIKGDMVYHTTPVGGGIFGVLVKPLGKTWTVRETDKNEFEASDGETAEKEDS